MSLIKFLDKLDALEGKASPGPWEVEVTFGPGYNEDLECFMRNHIKQLSQALREAHTAINKRVFVYGHVSDLEEGWLKKWDKVILRLNP